MADRYWVGTDTSWNTAANWSASTGGAGGAGVPTASDAVIFDGDYSNCTLDVDAECLSLTFAAGNVDAFDCDTYDLTVHGDVTIAGSGNVDWGSGSHECKGDWDTSSATGTFTRGTSTWTFSGTSKNITHTATVDTRNQFFAVYITGSVTNDSNLTQIYGGLTVSGSLTLTGTMLAYRAVDISGTVSGVGTLYLYATTGDLSLCTGTCSAGEVVARGQVAGGPVLSGSWAPTTFVLYGTDASGTITIGGSGLSVSTLQIDVDAGDALTIDCQTNSATLTITGDVIDEVDGTLTWQNYDTSVSGTADFDTGGTLTISGGTLDFGSGAVAVGATNVILDGVDLTCGNLTLDGAGDFDFGSGDHAIADFTVTGSGDVTLGSAAVECSGDLDVSGMSGEWNYNTGEHWTFTGTSKSITGGETSVQGRFNAITIDSSASITIADGQMRITGPVVIDGALTINGYWLVYGPLSGSGSITGSSDLWIYPDSTGEVSINFSHFASVTCAEVRVYTFADGTPTVDVGNGIMQCTDAFEIQHVSNGTIYLASGTQVLDCDVRFDIDAGGTVILDCQTNSATLTITGDVIDEVDGTLTWQKSAAGVTLNGSGNQDIDFDGSDIGPLTIANTGGTVTFSGAVECDSLIVEDGNIDFNAQTITINGPIQFNLGSTLAADQDGATLDYAGNFIANGQTINNLDFVRDAGGKHLAVNCTISNSTVSDGEILAPANKNNTDGGGNTGWNFDILNSGLNQRQRFLIAR